jgi:uncharacterized membrane protein YkgB
LAGISSAQSTKSPLAGVGPRARSTTDGPFIRRADVTDRRQSHGAAMKEMSAMTQPTTIPRGFAPAVRESELRLARWLARYSITLLRMSMGLVFLGFGVLKFVPGLSPAEPLAADTLQILTLGLLPERIGLLMVAGLESTIGVLLLTGLFMRVALALLAVELVGIMSPLVLLPGAMFGENFAPTLAGQYVIKDIIIGAAGLVVAARTLGARMIVQSPSDE